MDSSQTKEMSRDTIMAARTLLRKILYPPVIVSQITGTFPFSLASNADICFTWYDWPVFATFAKLVYFLLGFFLFIINQDDYTSILGGWSGIDLATTLLVVSTGYAADLFICLTVINDPLAIQSSHNDLVNLVVNILSETGTSSILHSQLETLKKKECWMKRRVTVVVILSLVNYTLGIFTGIFFGISFGKPLWLTASVVLVTYSVSGGTIIREVQVLVVAGGILWIWFGMRVLRCRLLEQVSAGNSRDLERLLQQWKRMNDMIEEFNMKFQWMLTCTIFVLLISILAAFYQFGSWMVFAGFFSTFATLPGIVVGVTVVCSVTAAATDVNSEGRLFIEALRDVGGCEWVRDNGALSRHVKLCHISGALQPPKIRPGHFFTLARSLFPSVQWSLVDPYSYI